MATQPRSITPTPPTAQPQEEGYSKWVHNTITDESEDNRGPWVYDLSLTPNLNGIDPLYNKKNGV
jgi:hypothetical protein